MLDVVVRMLSDMKHVPNLKRNLISLSTFDAKGYKHIGEGRILKVSKGVLIVIKGHKRTMNLYVLQDITVTSDAAVTTTTTLNNNVDRF